jgi:hypothetical protein
MGKVGGDSEKIVENLRGSRNVSSANVSDDLLSDRRTSKAFCNDGRIIYPIGQTVKQTATDQSFYLPSVFFFDGDCGFTSACPAGPAGWEGVGAALAETPASADLPEVASLFCESARLYQDSPRPKTVRIATNNPKKIARLDNP